MQFGSTKSSARPTKSGPPQVDGAPDELPKSDQDSAKRQGSAGPSPPGNRFLPVVERNSSPRGSSPQSSRSSSRSSSPPPASAIGSRTASPASFKYPFHQTMQGGLFDTHTPTAIRG